MSFALRNPFVFPRFRHCWPDSEISRWANDGERDFCSRLRQDNLVCQAPFDGFDLQCATERKDLTLGILGPSWVPLPL